MTVNARERQNVLIKMMFCSMADIDLIRTNKSVMTNVHNSGDNSKQCGGRTTVAEQFAINNVEG